MKTTHFQLFQLMPRLRKCGGIPPILLYAFMADRDSVFLPCKKCFKELCVQRNVHVDVAGISVELVGKQVRVSTDMAIFITMNPGYAGRSNLPDNLKKLFRSLAMTKPDRQLIAEVMLFSQGFRSAEKLACKIVPFFK